MISDQSNECGTPQQLDCTRYALEFSDDFEEPYLGASKWIPSYLPQWSSAERAKARFSIKSGVLTPLIEENQEPWSREHDGGLRVSNLQTGVFSGPGESTIGQHKFAPGLRVSEAQKEQRLCTPHY